MPVQESWRKSNASSTGAARSSSISESSRACWTTTRIGPSASSERSDALEVESHPFGPRERELGREPEALRHGVGPARELLGRRQPVGGGVQLDGGEP